MKCFKLLLKELLQDTKWEGKKEDDIKLGKVAFPFKGKTDDYEFDFKKGDEVYYQYGNKATFDGEEYILVSLTSLVCQK